MDGNFGGKILWGIADTQFQINDEMHLKTRQIVVTLNLDCFRRFDLHSNRVHVWMALLALTDKPTLLPPPVY